MKFRYILVICFILLVWGTCSACGPEDEELFLSFHPHLDAFWLNTDDQLKNINFQPQGFLYQMNQRNSKVLFNSMVEGLLQNPERKYFITEVVFLKDWYDSISSSKQKKVKSLIEKGQLEVTNGGWIQNDEAVCYIDDIIDQYTLGHNFLLEELGKVVKIAWATDSFGHSHSQAAIEHLLGIEIQGIERVDDRYIFKRKNGSLLEFYWSAVSDSNHLKYGGVYTHIRHFLHQFVNYRQMAPQQIGDDHQRISQVIKKLYRKNKMFRFVGNDFEEFIPSEFKKLEKAMSGLNDNDKKTCPKFKWGNPSDYFKWVQRDKTAKVPVRESDFIPNYDQDHYWAGYYTTNPQLKIVCKDFSRLINLFRKIYLKAKLKGSSSDMSDLFMRAEALLAVMQHHDGITATSKYYIEELFKKRMSDSTKQIIGAIKKLKNISHAECELYKNGNKCSLPSMEGSPLYFNILHEGVPKVELIQLSLPSGKFYQAQHDKDDNIFCSSSNQCVLIFQVSLKAGDNHVMLNSASQSAEMLKKWKNSDMAFKGERFSVEMDSHHLMYTPKNGQAISVSWVQSPNRPAMTQTTTWNKFGDPINKQERKMSGIYIMANNGILENFSEGQLKDLRVVEGKKYSKIAVSSKISSIIITISHQETHVLNLEADFKPTVSQQSDYFLRVDSPLRPEGVFYHDSNGYLVSRRKVGERSDYDWVYKKEDKINANTYPMCSFGYILDGNKKLVIFTDRAQGLTQYDDSLLINVDRLTSDDYKGAGEGYTHMVLNHLKFKIAIVEKSNYIQRKWQRYYDEALVGFATNTKPSSISDDLSTSISQVSQHQLLKYTIFLLNSDEFVLRLYNLAQGMSLSLPKHGEKEWNLSSVKLNIKYADIKESFANGIVLAERTVWKKIPGEINVFSAGSKDSHQQIVLEPLQIRSFRINLKSKIKDNQSKKPEERLADLEIAQLKPMSPLHSAFLRRCF